MTRTTVTHLGLILWLAAAGCKKRGAVEAAPTEVEQAADGPSASGPRADLSGTVEQQLTRAAGLLGEGTEPALLNARTILLHVTQTEPDNALGWYNLGITHQRTGAMQDAADAFTRATRTDPTLVDGWHGLGVVEASLGDPDLALRRFDKGLALAPEDERLHVGRMSALRALGRSREAVEAAKAALQFNARSLRIYNVMGLAYLDLDELDLARFVYEKAETVPGADEDATIQANFGWTLYRKGERYPAEVRLKRAVALDPDFVPGLVYLARLYLEDHNYADTVPLLETALSRAPNNHGVLMNLGIAYRGVGRLAEATAAWERALALVPTDPAPLFNLGILLGDDAKDYDGAIARFTAYIDAKGAESERATAYIDKVEREKKKAERQKKKEEDRKRKADERAERERLLDKAKQEAAPAPTPWDTGPTKKPAPEPAPEPEPAPSPWDTTGGETP